MNILGIKYHIFFMKKQPAACSTHTYCFSSANDFSCQLINSHGPAFNKLFTCMLTIKQTTESEYLVLD